MGRTHVRVAVAWIALVAVGAGPLASRLEGAFPVFAELGTLQEAVARAAPEARVQVVRGRSVFRSVIGSEDTTESFLRIDLVLRERPASYEEVAERAARAVLDRLPPGEVPDRIAVNVAYGFDIMISQSFVTRYFVFTAEEWRERIAPGFEGQSTA